MKVSDEERLKVIKSTPYFISENVLLNDLKWLIEQAEENIRCKESNEMYRDALIEITECETLDRTEFVAYSALEGRGRR